MKEKYTLISSKRTDPSITKIKKVKQQSIYHQQKIKHLATLRRLYEATHFQLNYISFKKNIPQHIQK